MSTPTFSILHASARPHGWDESYKSFLCNTEDLKRCEYILSRDERFGKFSTPFITPALKHVLLPEYEPQSSVANWNHAARCSTGSIIILNADDFRFPLKWDTELLKIIPDLASDFAVHVSTGSPDKYREDNLISFIIMSRARYEHQGWALFPGYESMESDMDFTEHAYFDGVVIQARHLLFEHIHPSWHADAPKDEVYQYQNRPEAYAHGAKILSRRRQMAFR